MPSSLRVGTARASVCGSTASSAVSPGSSIVRYGHRTRTEPICAFASDPNGKIAVMDDAACDPAARTESGGYMLGSLIDVHIHLLPTAIIRAYRSRRTPPLMEEDGSSLVLRFG